MHRLELVHNHWTASSLSIGALAPHEVLNSKYLFHSDFRSGREIGPCDIGGGQNCQLPLHNMVWHQSDCGMVHVILTALAADLHGVICLFSMILDSGPLSK